MIVASGTPFRIQRVLRVMLETRWNADDWQRIKPGDQEGHGREEPDSAGGVVQLMVADRSPGRPVCAVVRPLADKWNSVLNACTGTFVNPRVDKLQEPT